MANLAHTLKSRGRLPDALTLLGACCRLRNEVLGQGHPDTRKSVAVLDHWQGDHNLILSKRLQLQQSENLPEIILQEIAPAIVAQPYRLWHVGLAPTQGPPVPDFLSSNHALVIASKAPSASAGGQAMQDV
ncbi:hypothetical protein BDW69DRAFT_174564, partial [Aspergillus filifer]